MYVKTPEGVLLVAEPTTRKIALNAYGEGRHELLSVLQELNNEEPGSIDMKSLVILETSVAEIIYEPNLLPQGRSATVSH
jgi:hypothetical protein